MKRDYVCILRIFIDSLPSFFRNSKFLFNIAKAIFSLPDNLFYFRDDYFNGKISDLKSYYEVESIKSLNKISPKTDINSNHLTRIYDEFSRSIPSNLIDIGCGEGFLLNKFRKNSNEINLTGIDFNTNYKIIKKAKIEFIKGEIFQELTKLPSKSYDFVLCTHVLEHLENPKLVLKEIRRICAGTLIIICPLEKKFKWGFNYHIQFFSDKENFINFLKESNSSKNTKQIFKTYQFLGDIMYLEYL